MKRYEKIISLDFEMYNSMRYWSICWIGAVISNAELDSGERLDIKLNPGTSHKLVGKELKFPFKYSDLKPLDRFDKASAPLMALLDENTLVIGHAIDNDVKMLLTACAYYKMDCPDFDYIDTNVVKSALKGQFVQTALTSLAEEYGYEFEAHNPVEDAAATLVVLKNMLRESGLALESVESLGVEIGRVRGGLARRCFAHCLSEKARLHIDNYNAVFDAALAAGQGEAGEESGLRGVKIAVDGKLQTSQNLYPLVLWVYESGGRVVYDSHLADVILTSEMSDRDRFMSLREFALKYGMPPAVASSLDFCPNKVTFGGETFSYTQYLRKKYASGGSRGGKTYCFAHEIERRLDFEEIAAKLLRRGDRVVTLPERRVIFVIDSEQRLKDDSDHKVFLFKRLAPRTKKPPVLLSELV